MSSLNDYVCCEEVGTGCSSRVISAIHKPTNKSVAIKHILKEDLESEKDLQYVYQEIEILKKLHHPFICQYFDSFETDTVIYIIMENAQIGTLLNFVNNLQGLLENDAVIIFSQILSALRYLHNVQHIAHRDLKNENILLDRNKRVRLIDFGLSKALQKSDDIMKTKCGSPNYISPEMINNGYYTMESDVWSLGIILYSIVACKLPFDSSNMKSLFNTILYKEADYPEKFSPKLVDLLNRMLAKNPEERINLEEIAEHPWVKPKSVIANITENTITVPDKDVFEYMKQFGYNAEECEANMKNGVQTPATVAFKILKRDLETKEINNYINRSAFGFPILKTSPHMTTLPAMTTSRPIVCVPARNHKRFSSFSPVAVLDNKGVIRTRKVGMSRVARPITRTPTPSIITTLY